jgi:tetratricopeptide (TPR) repeat protein
MRSILRQTAIFSAVLLCGGALPAAGQGKAILRRLAVEAAQWRGLHGAALAAGLKEDAYAVTPGELDLLARTARSPGVASVVYLNRYGQVRWSEDAELIALPLEEYQKKTGAVLQAAAEVLTSTAVLVRQAQDAPVYEAAIPIVAEGVTQGVLDLWVRRDGIFGLLSERAPAVRKSVRPAPTEPPIPSAPPPRAVALPAPAAARPAPAASADDVSRQAQQFYLSGMIYYEKGDYGKALKEWETAHKLDPEDQDVSAGLARVRQFLGQTPAASGEDIPLRADPDAGTNESRSGDLRSSRQHYLAGAASYDKGDYAKAREEWSEAVRIDPDNADAAAGLARVERLVTPDDSKNCVDLYQARRYDDAATACAACLDKDPNSAACDATRRLLEGRVP